MNKISDEEIMCLLQTRLEELYQIIPKDRVLGICTVGAANHGLVKDINDIKVYAFYLPTKEQLYFDELLRFDFSCPLDDILKNINLMNFKDIYKWSLRDVYYSEILFTKYYILNERYKDLVEKELFRDKEYIVLHNRKDKILKCIDSALKRLSTKDYSYRNMSLIYGLYLFLSNTVTDKVGFENMLKPRDIAEEQLIWNLYHGDSSITENDLKELHSKLETEIETIAEYYNNNNTDTRESNKEALKRYRNAIMAIIDLGLQDTDNISKFKNSLTDLEKVALLEILKIIEGEGCLSISKIVKATNISRPVYMSVLNKMEKNNIATLQNRGAKGTYIKLLTSRL